MMESVWFRDVASIRRAGTQVAQGEDGFGAPSGFVGPIFPAA